MKSYEVEELKILLLTGSLILLQMTVKHQRVYVNLESEESMSVIMKCNTFIRMAYALLQLTKRYLRKASIALKISEPILQRICFEIRKNNPNFYFSGICGPLKEGPRGKCIKGFPPQYDPLGILRLLFAIK